MNRGKILLIDDDADMVSIGEQVFSKAGFQFLSARNGREGLKKMSSMEPDLVLLDFLLPDMKGFELLDRVDKDDKYAHIRSIPFVILTAWEEEFESIKPYFAKGLHAYLIKPFGYRELKCVVENIIEKARITRHSS